MKIKNFTPVALMLLALPAFSFIPTAAAYASSASSPAVISVQNQAHKHSILAPAEQQKLNTELFNLALNKEIWPSIKRQPRLR